MVVAAAMKSEDRPAWEELARGYKADGLRVPATVTSYDPNGAPPRQVDVARVTS